jgi:hypothetical protein
MKTYRASAGPFAERPFYKPEDIDRICSDELQAVGLYPADPEPIRVERFIEKRFGVRVTYDDLPDGLLGFTEFGDKGVKAIVLAKSLDDEGTQAAERRIRTTMAHEGAGHGLLHTHLMVLGAAARPLFKEGMDPTLPRILCRTGGTDAARAYDGKWWELQANQAMGALLLPTRLVDTALEPLLVARGSLGARVLDAHRSNEAVRLLADTFDVNPVVARIRIVALYPDVASGQLTL